MSSINTEPPEPAATEGPLHTGELRPLSAGTGLALTGQAVGAADDDNSVLQAWLAVFEMKSPQTANSYRSQSNKFRMFLQLLHPQRPQNFQLKLATEMDVAAYEAALSHQTRANLTLPSLRLTQDQLQHFGWARQPFASPLKRSSVNQAVAVLHAMFDYFRTPNAGMREPYVVVNPARRVVKAGNRKPTKIDRVLPKDALRAMNTYLVTGIENAQAHNDLSAVRRMERQLWMLSLLFGLWARREEVVKLSMGDFFQAYDGTWYVKLQRKGSHEQDVPVPDWVMHRLGRYRKSMNLPAQHAPGEPLPAVLDVRYTEFSLARRISAHTLYMQIKDLAACTADELSAGQLLAEMAAEERKRIASILQRCSPHWFRHTGPTIAINSGAMTLPDASHLLGHQSTATTSLMYHHADEAKTRAGMEELGLIWAG